LIIAGGAYTEPPAGLPDVGAVVGWGTPVMRVLLDIASIGTVGWLMAATVLDPSARDGVVSTAGRRDLMRAAGCAVVWAMLALAESLFTLANVLALPLGEALSPRVIATYANEIPTVRALAVMAMLAVVIAIGCIMTSSTSASAGWLIVAMVAVALPALGGHSSGLGDHALALSAGVAHVVAATLWIGGVVALGVHAVSRDIPFARAAQRFAPFGLASIALVALSGVGNAYARLDYAEQLITTPYGELVIVKSLLVISLAVIGWIIRRKIIARLGDRSGVMAFARVAGIELVIMALALGLGVALSQSPIPRVLTDLPSYGESLLGYRYPPEPTLANVVTGIRIEPLFFTLCVVAAAVYLAGAIKLARRKDHWPLMRTVSWLLGVFVVMWCTNSGLAEYANVSVTFHMVQHMTLAMLAPILLVLGAPATLALRALRPAPGSERGPREWLVWLLHSKFTGFLTNPFFVLFLYVTTLYGLYLTPAFGWLMGSHVGHMAMTVHFVASGYLFYWVLIGIDPRPKPLPYWARLLMLLIGMAVHAFLAVVLMMGSQPLAPEWYGIVRPTWVTDPLADSLTGGQVAWALAEVPGLIVLIAIAMQWARSDDREATRRDRAADRDGGLELDAYNARLASYAKRDATDASQS
jgi:putative copper resistance protein D